MNTAEQKRFEIAQRECLELLDRMSEEIESAAVLLASRAALDDLIRVQVIMEQAAKILGIERND